MDRKNLGPVLTNGQLSEVRTLLQQLKRSGSLLDLASPRVASLLRAIDLENDGTTVLVETPRIDETGDIAIPDEVVDLRLLLDCRHERNVLQKICAERSDELDRLSTRLEVRQDGGPDGIECRDETIRMQDREIDRLRAENDRLEVLDKRRCEEIRRLYSRDRQSLQDFNNLRAENEALKSHITNLLSILYASRVEIDRFEYQMMHEAHVALRGEGDK